MPNTGNANGATILTVPAGKFWKGSISLSATLAVAAGGAAGTQYPSITVSGADGSWADGDTVLRLALFVPAVSLTALAGALASGNISISDIQVKAGANPITLILNIGPGVTGTGTAIGEIR